MADHDFGCFRCVREMVLEDMVKNGDNSVWAKVLHPEPGVHDEQPGSRNGGVHLRDEPAARFCLI